ncbi:phosphatase PAP2 family protein [Streptomyces sp. NPDC053427]|uniref:phosphatase PAP2 family protein n=1 Tax=Streptomyces sp. NPDC053427 TaxID=3365701 RepID=UPI0037D87B3F
MALPAPTSRPAVRPRPPLALLAVLTLLSVLLTVLVVARWGPLLSLDASLANALHRCAVTAPAWTRVNRLLSDWVWDPWAMRVVLAAVVVRLVRRGAWPLGLWVAGTALVGTALQQTLKAAVGRARPVWPDPVDSAHYAAFPSGHALSVTVAGGLVLWLLRRHGARSRRQWAARTIVAVSVVGVGFTRVHLGVHWPSDVIGGWLLGGALVAGAAAAYPAYARRVGRAAARDRPGAGQRRGWPS